MRVMNQEVLEKEIGLVDTDEEFRKKLRQAFGETIEICGVPCDPVRALELSNPIGFYEFKRAWTAIDPSLTEVNGQYVFTDLLNDYDNAHKRPALSLVASA